MSADKPAQTHVYEGEYLVDWPDDERFLPMREVCRRTSMSRTTILTGVDAGRFPRPIQLGGAEGLFWLQSEILAWLGALTTKRPEAPAESRVDRQPEEK